MPQVPGMWNLLSKGGHEGGMRDPMHICQQLGYGNYMGATLSNSDEGFFRVIDTVLHKPCGFVVIISLSSLTSLGSESRPCFSESADVERRSERNLLQESTEHAASGVLC